MESCYKMEAGFSQLFVPRKQRNPTNKHLYTHHGKSGKNLVQNKKVSKNRKARVENEDHLLYPEDDENGCDSVEGITDSVQMPTLDAYCYALETYETLIHITKNVFAIQDFDSIENKLKVSISNILWVDLIFWLIFLKRL